MVRNYLVPKSLGTEIFTWSRNHLVPKSLSPVFTIILFYKMCALFVSSVEYYFVKIDWNCNFVGLLHHPFWLKLVSAPKSLGPVFTIILFYKMCALFISSVEATQTGIPCGTLEIFIQEVLWSIRGSYWAIWSNPLTNVKWHSDPWPTVTSLPIRLSTNFMTFIPSLTFTELWVVSMEHLQRVWLASRERLPFRTPGSVPHFGTC